MKKLFALTMAGICAIAFAAAADAASTLRMKAPTVKTATRTASNIVGSGSVEVQHVYADWSTCATNYRDAEGGKYEVTTLYLGSLLTSQQVYDDLRNKFLTTEFDFTKIANNGTSTTTKTTQQVGLLSTLVPSVADETILTAVISVGKAYNGQQAGNNYYDFQSTTDTDGKFKYSDFATVSSSGILNDKVIPGRVASYTGLGTEAADLSAATASNNGKTFSKEEAAQKSAELENLFYVSEKANWDNQQEANKIAVKNLVSQLQSRYDSFTNAQMSEMGKTQDALDAIVAGLNNGSLTYEEALAKLQDIIDGIKNFDKAGYNALLNDYAAQLAALKSSFESEFAARKALNDSTYAAALAQAESDKAALEATRDNAIADATQERDDAIAAAKALVNLYNAAQENYSNLLEQCSDERDAINDNYDSQIDQLQNERDTQVANLEANRDSQVNSLTNSMNTAVANAKTKVANYKNLKAQFDAKSVSEYNSAVNTVNNINSEFDKLSVGLNEAINNHMGPNGTSYTLWYSASDPDNALYTSYITGLSDISYDQNGNITAYTMNCICRSQGTSTLYEVGESFTRRRLCTDSNTKTGGSYLDWIDTMSADYYTNTYQPYRAQVEAEYNAARVIKDSYESLQKQVNSAYAAINGNLNYAVDMENSYKSQISSVQDNYNSQISSVTSSFNAQISAAEDARTAELNALSEKYYGENGLATQAKMKVDLAKASCDGDPSTYESKKTRAANAIYNTKVSSANNAYQSGVDKIDTELADLKAANEAALKAIEDKYASDKLALEKKAEAALASFVFDQFVAMQNADNEKMLAELKAELTSFINGLTDSKGNAYSTSNILGYDSMQFNQVSYKTIAYDKKYSSAEYAAEKAKGTFEVDEAEVNEVEVGDNQFLSALNVSSTSKVTMVDGVLQEVTTNTESLYLTSIYLEVGRKYISPIVLDIKGDGVLQASDGQHLPGHTYVKNNNIVTDFYGDGFEIAMEWVGPQDGLLVAPKADGSVDMSCLFGVAGGYESGYEKLSLYDKNGDDKVSGEELNGLSVWQDANSNGIADEGEVKTVQELGITSLSITNSLDFTSTFERNGQSYKMWDWWPNAVELIKVAAK